MAVTTIFFDLDGTLLPMDMDEFIKGYSEQLIKKMAPLGYEPQALMGAIMKGIGAMVKNNGECSNEEMFWKTFSALLGNQVLDGKEVFDEFYDNEFQHVKEYCGFNPLAGKVIAELRTKGFELVLATNPLFPCVATESRMKWAGIDKNDFCFFTVYENFNYAKPNPEYYKELLRRLQLKPEECLMVGNDVTEDMIAETLGMKVFLVTDCLINIEGKDISGYPQGGLDDLMEYIQNNI